MKGSAYCLNHDPTRAAKNHRNAVKAGRAGGRGRPSSELRRLQAMFEDLAQRLDDRDDSLERADAAVMCQCLQGARACVRDLLAAREQEELVERLEALEGALSVRKSGSGYYA
jgi:hypothetical protein